MEVCLCCGNLIDPAASAKWPDLSLCSGCGNEFQLSAVFARTSRRGERRSYNVPVNDALLHFVEGGSCLHGGLPCRPG